MVETKAIPIGKHNEQPNDLGLETLMKDLMNCLKESGRHYYPVSSYATRQPPGVFLKYILAKGLKGIDKIIEIKCGSPKSSHRISKELEAMRSDQEEELRELFKEEKEAFKMLYFNPLKSLLVLALEEEELSLITITGLSSLHKEMEFLKNLKESKVKYIIYLKDLTMMAREICIGFGKAEAKRDEDDLKEKKEEKEETTDVVKNWEKYIEFVIDISEHCEPITESINKIGENFINKQHSPKFNIYKIFVGMFIKFYYRGIAHKCPVIFKRKLERLNKNIIDYYAYVYLDNQTKEQGKSSTRPPKDPGDYNKLLEDIQEVHNFFTVLLSLNMNELSVHYLYITSFLDRIGYSTAFNDILESINTMFFVACKYINEEHGDSKEQIIRGMYYEYKKIFPPCFILDIKKYMDEVEYEELENKMIPLIKDCFKNKPEMKEIKDDINEVLNDAIKSACKKMKREPNDEELEKIKYYIKENAEGLIKDLEAKEMQDAMEEFHENAILERNELACGPLTSETNACFSIEGIEID